MASNLALKRTRRALQRKRAVAQKRRLELVESRVGVQARRATAAPIRLCLMQGDTLNDGIASIVLGRGQTAHAQTVAVFLVDAFCLGIKDVFIHDLDSETLLMLTDEMAAASPLTPIEPSYARRLLHEAAAWATSIGFRPHRDFVAIEQIFGEVDADACDATFTFGRDGKPFYVPGPTETRTQVRNRIAHLLNRFGESGFDYSGFS